MIARLSSKRDGAAMRLPPSFDGLTFVYAHAFSENVSHPRGDMLVYVSFSEFSAKLPLPISQSPVMITCVTTRL